MRNNAGFPRRHSPVHQPILWPQDGQVVMYLTVNAKARKPIFARPDVHELLVDTWSTADFWLVGRYVIMPDHIHILCAPGRPDAPLSRWVQFWKSMASRAWPRPEEKPVWQRDYWDTQLRPYEGYEEKWEYIRMNPVRRGLVTDPADWPFAGEIHPLDWRGN